MKDRRYPDIALAALREMVDRKGFLDPWDTPGGTPARRGVLVRHLVMPGEVENSLGCLRLLRKEFGRLLPLSVMSQYRPTPAARARGRFTRRVAPDEYRRVLNQAQALGFEHLFMQSLDDGDVFVPDFGTEHPFQGNRE